MNGIIGPSRLHDPDQALSAYLETLLGPVACPPSPEDGGTDEFTEPACEETPDEWSSVCVMQAGRLRLLLPMSRVDTVIAADPLIPGGFGEPFRGLLAHQGRRAVCVDLEAVVQPDSVPVGSRVPSLAVVTGNGRWALLCNAAETDRPLDPVSVRWRRRQGISSRPWLAGTSMSLRSVLLDADELTRWLWSRLRGQGPSESC